MGFQVAPCRPSGPRSHSIGERSAIESSMMRKVFEGNDRHLAACFCQPLVKIAIAFRAVAGSACRNDVARFSLAALCHRDHVIPCVRQVVAICATALEQFEQILFCDRRNGFDAALVPCCMSFSALSMCRVVRISLAVACPLVVTAKALFCDVFQTKPRAAIPTPRFATLACSSALNAIWLVIWGYALACPADIPVPIRTRPVDIVVGHWLNDATRGAPAGQRLAEQGGIGPFDRGLVSH